MLENLSFPWPLVRLGSIAETEHSLAIRVEDPGLEDRERLRTETYTIKSYKLYR
jgi:hypothetical protein